jgi:rhodanese-related sulfurtransferase
MLHFKGVVMGSKRQLVVSILVSVIVCIFSGSVVFAEEFPYRKDFPKVSYISTQELKAKYDKNEAVIVDVRSKIEFDVIHVKKSLHIPMAYATFVEEIGKLIKENPGKIIAFYCNGVTCLKSYESAQKMVDAGYKNSFAYDAGIPDWSKKYPSDTLVFEKVLTNPDKQLISDNDFNKRLINFETFKTNTTKANTIVIDIRDYIQNAGKLPGIENAKIIPLDMFIPNFVQKKIEQDKTLLIFDQVGKQVKWLMYYLRDYGYTNYFFLDKGATEVIKKQEYK